MEVIRVKEEVEAKENKWRAAIKAMENERSDLRFVVTKKDFRLQQLEAEIIRLKEKLDTTLVKNYMPSQNEILKIRNEDKKLLGLHESNILGRKQGIEITNTLPENFNNVQGIEGSNEAAVWAEELRTADERSGKFKQQADKLEKELEDAKKIMESYKKQVESRDMEIKRLQGLYEGGQNLDKLASKYTSNTNEQLVARLNGHIDFLNKENHRLESELKKCKPEDRLAAANAEKDQQLRASQLIKRNELMVNSVKELEKTVEILQRERQGLEAKMNEMENENDERLGAEKKLNEELNQRIGELESQLNTKQKETEITTNAKAALNSDKKVIHEALEKAKKENSELTRLNKEQKSEIQKLGAKLEDARINLNALMGKSANAAREAEMAHASAGRVENEIKEQGEECTKLRQHIHELESELLTIKNEKTNLKFEADRLVKQKYNLEEQLMAFKNESLKRKSEAEGSGATASRLEGLYNSAKAEIDYLKKDNEQLENLLIQQKEKVAGLDKQNKEYYMELTISNENIKTLQQEHKMLSDELSAKVGELRKAEASLNQYERKLFDMKSLEDQVSSLTSQCQKYMQERVKIEGEKVDLQDQIKQLEAQAQVNDGIVNELNEETKTLKNSNAKLLNDLKQLQEENIIIKTKADKTKIVERDVQMHKETLQVMQKKDIDISKELEETKEKLAWVEMENDGNKRKAVALEARLSELEADSKARVDENIALRLKLNEQELKVGVGEQQQKGLALQSGEVQKILQEERKEREKLEKDLKNAAKEIDNARSKEVILKDQINKLKSLVENLDSTKDELLAKIKNSTQGKKGEENEKMNLVQQIGNLKNLVAQREREAADAKNSLTQLDATMDQLQAELDSKTIELEKTKTELAKASKELQQIHSHADQLTSNEDIYQKRIVERENEIRELGQKLTETSKELEDTKETLFYKNQELESLANDVQVLTKENQCVNAELVKLNQAREKLKEMTEGMQKKEKTAQQTLRATELEREDILNSYKTVCEENERLHENANTLANENKEMLARLQELEKEIYGRDLKLQGAEENERKIFADMQALERQVTHLTKELEKAHGALNENEGVKQSIIEDMENAKQMSFTLEANKEELQKTIEELGAIKAEQDGKIAESEKQKELLKTQIEQEKARYSELELVLANERNKQNEQHLQLQNAEKEKNELKQSISDLNVRIAGTFI